jgi:hypothetical protein
MFVGCVIPTLLLKGKYNVTGRIFELPIEGAGAYSSLLSTYGNTSTEWRYLNVMMKIFLVLEYLIV